MNDVAEAGMAAELAQHAFFARLAPALRDRLAECAELAHFAADCQILTQGDPANSFYAVLSGRVAVGVHTPGRGLDVIDTLEAGDILGWSWLFEPYEWTFDAVALQPVEAIQIHAQCIRPILDDEPKIAYTLVKEVAAVMAGRLASARMRLVDIYGPYDHG